jgi:hypothetical protein
MRRMRSKFPGRCDNSSLTNCSGIKPGQEIVWAGPGQGAWHVGCGPTGVDALPWRHWPNLQQAVKWAGIVGGEAGMLEMESHLDSLYGDPADYY